MDRLPKKGHGDRPMDAEPHTLPHRQPVPHTGWTEGPQRIRGTSPRWNPEHPRLASAVSPEEPGLGCPGHSTRPAVFRARAEALWRAWGGKRLKAWPSPGFPHSLPPTGAGLGVRKEKERIRNPTSYHIQKFTQNGSKVSTPEPKLYNS